MTERKLMSHCPFCNAARASDDPAVRRYACGSVDIRRTGIYHRRCR